MRNWVVPKQQNLTVKQKIFYFLKYFQMEKKSEILRNGYTEMFLNIPYLIKLLIFTFGKGKAVKLK